jgi:ATP-binding cassette subfamily B multidrug efflux pump
MKALRYLNKYFKKYRSKLLIGLLITISARVFSLIMPSYVNASIQVIENYNKGLIQMSEAKAALLEDILIIIGTTLISATLTFLMRQYVINVSRYIEYDLKNEVFEHYLTLDLGFYKKNRIGDLMNRISEDVSQVRMYAGPALMYGFQTLTLFVILIPLMFIKAPTIAFYTVLPLPVLSVLIYRISRIIHQRSTKVQQFLSTLSTFTQEAFSGIAVVKAYRLENNLDREISDLANEGKETSMSLAKVNAWFFPMMILLIGLSNILVMYIGGREYLAGNITSVGVIAEFILYVNMLTWPVAVVGWLTSIIQRAEASQKRINEFLQTKPEIVNTNFDSIELNGELEFKKVSHIYDDTKIQALKEVSFKINKGETLAIMGKTGSGKSTLLELIARLMDPTSGEIYIDGIKLQDYNLDVLRSSIGTVPQDAFLFSETIEKNIAFSLDELNQEDVIEAAKKAMVHDNIIEFKDGYQTVLGERGITLSGGQKQRVSIARALIKNPKLFLFDDCLSAVDTETEEKILNELKESSAELTTFIVSHRVSSVKHADQILILDQGEIVQQGSHEQLLKDKNGYYFKQYSEQLAQ